MGFLFGFMVHTAFGFPVTSFSFCTTDQNYCSGAVCTLIQGLDLPFAGKRDAKLKPGFILLVDSVTARVTALSFRVYVPRRDINLTHSLSSLSGWAGLRLRGETQRYQYFRVGALSKDIELRPAARGDEIGWILL